MKNAILILLVTGFIIGCSPNEANVALVDQYIEAVESKDFDTMTNLLADNYVGIGPSYGDSTNKISALESWAENIDYLYDKIEYQKSRTAPILITSGDNQGSWVANWAQLKITYKGDKGSVTILANTNYQIENGKIVKSYTFYNEADALRQLDYVFINLNEL